MVDRRVEAGQLNNTEITQKDLKVIIDSFTATLKGSYHSRVDYPDDEPSQDNSAQQSSDDETLVGSGE
jgi:hypothetical protein